MSLAVVLSVAVPLGIALMPAGMSGSSSVDAVIDEIPIPGIIEFHGDDPAPLATAGNVASSAPDLLAPAAVESPWSTVPNATANGNGPRFAHFRDDVEAPGSIQEVGNNQPAAARSRGAWLTGTIEEVPSAARPLSRSQAPRF